MTRVYLKTECLSAFDLPAVRYRTDSELDAIGGGFSLREMKLRWKTSELAPGCVCAIEFQFCES